MPKTYLSSKSNQFIKITDSVIHYKLAYHELPNNLQYNAIETKLFNTGVMCGTEIEEILKNQIGMTREESKVRNCLIYHESSFFIMVFPKNVLFELSPVNSENYFQQNLFDNAIPILTLPFPA